MNDLNTTDNTNNTTSHVSITERGLDADGNYRFLSYDAKAPLVESGKRTIKLMYKVNTKTGKAAGINSCLLVSPVSKEELTDDVIKSLTPHIINMIEAEQDKIAKAAHISGVEAVSPDSLSISSVISSLETVAQSQRMNKEVISSWFTENLADTLTVLFADKLGVSETPSESDTANINRFLDVYKTKFNGLASNLVSYQKEEAEKLLEAVEKCEVDKNTDLVSGKIIEKLNKMANPLSQTELMDLL